MEIDAKDLESTLSNDKMEAAPESAPQPQMSKEEEIGFHKGSLNTLVSERNELVKMVGNVENIMQMHITRLKELGVDVGNGK